MRVLLLDAAFSAAPIHRALTDAGHEVWVMGSRPEDILARKSGDHWVNQDYSRVDEVAVHLRRLGIQAVVPGCTDVSMDTAVQLTLPGSRRLDSMGTNRQLGNKALFRQLCVDLDLPAPKVVPKDTFPRPGRFICKPVDAFSGRGISTFDGTDERELSEAWRVAVAASRGGEAIIEHFAQGPLHSCSAFLVSHGIVQAFYVVEGSSSNPYAVDTSHLVDTIPPACRVRLESAMEKLSRRLGLTDGLLHVQFILDGDEPFIVEVARRCPGDLYALLIEYSTGFGYAAAYAASFVGEPLPAHTSVRRHVLRHTVSALRDDPYEGLRFRSPQPVKAFYPLQVLGQDMLARQKSRSGVLFTEYPDEPALAQAYHQFMSRTAYDVAW